MEKIEYRGREYILKAVEGLTCKGCSFVESDSDCQSVLKISKDCIRKNKVWQPLIYTSGKVLKEDDEIENK